MVDEVDQARIGVVEVLEDHRDGAPLGDPLEERSPGGEQLLRTAACRLDAEQGEQSRLDPAAIRLVWDVLDERLGDLQSRRRLVVRLEQARASPDHLAERPEADPLAVCRTAADVPVRRIDDAIGVLGELPAEPALSDTGRADDRDQAGAPIPPGRVEQVLEQSDLVVATDERGLQRLGSGFVRRARRRPGAPAMPGRGWSCP